MEERNAGPSTLLAGLAEKIRAAIQAGKHGNGLPKELLFLVLADYFNYNVTQGGFAQLVYNAQGAYLEEMEDMLIAAGAPIAQDYYAKAVMACLNDQTAYHAFIGGEYMQENRLKRELHAISIAYFQERTAFIEEAAAWLKDTADKAEQWLQENR